MELFHAALEITEEARPGFLEEKCRDDPDLIAEVTFLIAGHERKFPLGSLAGQQSEVFNKLKRALEDRYTVVRELGSGGMAVVFLAEDLKHRRKVAIKVLRPELGAALGSERFLREIEIAAGLQHPHILPLYDSGDAGGLLYYVMPFVEGPTLADRLSTGALPLADAQRLGAEILSALDHAHRNGIVHRDIKPANILLSASGGHAMVADFGIARAVSAAGGDKLTGTGAAIGTPGYMPPEQLNGEQVTPATDVYASGVVLWECITGVRWAVTDENSADWSGFPTGVARALRRALARAPRERWPDAAAFRRALLSERTAPRRGGLAAVGAIAAAVVGVVAWVLFGEMTRPSGVDSATRVAVLPFSVRGSPEFSYLGDGMVDLLSTKLDGAGNWRSVDPRMVLSVVQRRGDDGEIDLDDGVALADILESDLFVLGNVVEVGGRVRIDASLYDRDEGMEAIARASEEGADEDVLDLVDRMAGRLLAGHPETRDARLSQTAMVTTGSLAALKSYLRGAGAMRAGFFPQAADAFREAVVADTAFALAWYRLSVAAEWLLRPDLAREASEEALRFADRLSERDGRLLEALAAAQRGNPVEAELLYRSIIGTYPDDVEAWTQLSELMSHFSTLLGRSLEEARGPLERLASLEPDKAGALVHLARLEASRGDAEALDEVVRRIAELTPESDRTPEMRMLQAFTDDDREERSRVLADLRDSNDEVLAEVAWSAGAYLRDPRAIALLVEATTDHNRSVEIRAMGYRMMSDVELAQGRLRRATAQLDMLESLDPVMAVEHGAQLAVTPELPVDTAAVRFYLNRVLAIDGDTVPDAVGEVVWLSVHNGLHSTLLIYLEGLLHAALGEEPEALDASRRLLQQEVPAGSGSLIPDLARGIRASVAWRAGRVSEAAAELDDLRVGVGYLVANSSPFYSLGRERYLHARALEETGRPEEALRWYGSFTDAAFSDIVYRPLSHLRRAFIYESFGDQRAAEEHFRRFLDMWRSPDPALDEIVERARQGLARVRGAPADPEG